MRSERIYARSSPGLTRPFPEKKADPYWNLFDLAENAGDPQISQKLKELHAAWIQEIPAEATEVMFAAVLRGDRETVRALLESGQKPDHQQSDWSSFLSKTVRLQRWLRKLLRVWESALSCRARR